jgi:hypothetical protein
VTAILRRQIKAAILGGRTERLPFVIIAAGAWIALRLISGRKNGVVYKHGLRPGESITITAPGVDRRG